ncbi:MBL fold metallo-hydrolase [Aminobacter aminovorans]|uniref:MBL fold metallo-hydrolase n=1 Tax=Aminobacter aminovorans TaxID=83263 RepID=UPI002854A603|nr:MBL fold metallo-hydrolase [Aminobacter aminovorans]MDR7224136.1 glyoxylase-like metal-dependent hydrolase (beta-lactamase superfamily II) [Aminobacter aminovorans]
MKVIRRHFPELGIELEQLHAGPVVVTCIPDMANVAWPAKAIFAGLSREDLEAAFRRSPEGTVDPEGETVALSFNCYVIEAPDYVALIDGGIGDGKERPHRPAWHRRETKFLQTLAAIGISPERVDIVINTHLHADHVGWNTRREGETWRPAFPNARYVVAETELAHWTKVHEASSDGNTLHGAFADSVLPIIRSVGFEAVASDAEVAVGLRLKPAPGHSPGMVVVSLVSGEGEVLFLADAVHHPLQLGDDGIVCNFCEDPVLARATRIGLLGAAAARGTVLAPYHFPAPVFGRLTAEAASFRFVPLSTSRQPASLQTTRQSTMRAETRRPEEN